MVQPTEPICKFGIDSGLGHEGPELPPQQLAVGSRIKDVVINSGEFIRNRHTWLGGFTFACIVIAGVKAFQLFGNFDLAETIAGRLPDNLFRERQNFAPASIFARSAKAYPRIGVAKSDSEGRPAAQKRDIVFARSPAHALRDD